jgi:hypothetical protein
VPVDVVGLGVVQYRATLADRKKRCTILPGIPNASTEFLIFFKRKLELIDSKEVITEYRKTFSVFG